MKNSFKGCYARYNYTGEKGVICNLPAFKKGIHLTIGFNNERKEFNIHFTDDNIKEVGSIRRKFILVMSSFRFFLLINRFEKLYNFRHLKMISDSEINLGKLKRQGIMFFHLPDSIVESKLLHLTKKGRKISIRDNVDLNAMADGFLPITEIHSCTDTFFQAYKWKGEHLSFQGIIFKANSSGKLYFVPKKKYNRLLKQNAIDIYNYLNKYPTPETLEFRKIAFNNLKHPYLNK
jgi:hypothetical protein